MLTVKDVCKHLGISRRTVYRLIKSGRLPAKRITGQRSDSGVPTKSGWRFELKDVTALLNYVRSPTKYLEKPDLMSVKEAGAYLGLSRRTIYRLITAQKLPAVKSGGRWRFSREDVKQFLTRGRPVPAQVWGADFAGAAHSGEPRLWRGVIKLSEACKRLGITRRTIYRLIKEGKLPATKVAGQWRLIKTEVSRYLLDKKYRYGITGVKGVFFWSQVLDKYQKQQDIYYINESAYDGVVGNRQEYYDYKTLGSLKATRPEDKFFAEVHYRKVPVKGGYILAVPYQQYDHLPTEEYVHWSNYRVPEDQLKHLQL